MNAKPGAFPWTETELKAKLTKAVADYWAGRGGQSKRQGFRRAKDVGTRREVTGGQHLNAIATLLCEVIAAAGFKDSELRFNVGVELPGYFRPQKKWDIVVAREGRLCAAVEFKSQVGSFGKNFNNRCEEALGSSTDLWTAFREGALGAHQPWLGYFFLLENAGKSTRPVGLKNSEFPPFPIFEGTSYAERYAILCERLVLERKYSATSLVLASRGRDGIYVEPVLGLGFHPFARSLFGHLCGCV